MTHEYSTMVSSVDKKILDYCNGKTEEHPAVFFMLPKSIFERKDKN